MSIDQVLEALGLGLVATVNVGLWTLRVALATAGRRVAASMLAGVEAVLFALVFGTLMASLDDPLRVAGYALGVAAGTLLGIVANDRLSQAQTQALVTVVVDGDGHAATAGLHARGWPATLTAAAGVQGPVALLSVTVPGDALEQFRRDMAETAPEAPVLVGALQTLEPVRRPRTDRTGTRRTRGT